MSIRTGSTGVLRPEVVGPGNERRQAVDERGLAGAPRTCIGTVFVVLLTHSSILLPEENSFSTTCCRKKSEQNMSRPCATPKCPCDAYPTELYCFPQCGASGGCRERVHNVPPNAPPSQGRQSPPPPGDPFLPVYKCTTAGCPCDAHPTAPYCCPQCLAKGGCPSRVHAYQPTQSTTPHPAPKVAPRDAKKGTNPFSVTAGPPDPCKELADKWALVAATLTPTEREPMDTLMIMIGLRHLKDTMLDLYKAFIQTKSNPSALKEFKERTLNFAFLGNPGTGKSEACALIARILFVTGLRDDPSVINKKAGEMLQEGSTKFLTQLDSMVPNKAPPSDILREGLVVMTQASNGKGYKSTITQVSKDPTTNEKVYAVKWEDGTTDRDFKAASIKPITSPRVLVVDETYDLRPQSDTQGRAIYNGLMRVMEDNRQDVSVIFAGYPSPFSSFNSGMASRLTKITFADYDNDELTKIWDVMCTKKQMTSSPEARQYAVRIASRKWGTLARCGMFCHPRSQVKNL